MIACPDDCGAAGPADHAYRRVLWTVLALNAAMFVTEGVAGVIADSLALQADALDFLGDSATYGITLFVLSRPLRWRASAALLKGGAMALFGVGVLGNALYRTFAAAEPEVLVMGGVGALALVVNLGSALLLFRHRDGDSNRRSVWLCSRNDALANLGVIAAALGVHLSGTPWPDLAVGALIAVLALSGGVQVLRQAGTELRGGEAALDTGA